MSQILNIDINSKKYDQKDIGKKIEMIYNSKLVHFFKQNGYKTYNLSFLDINNTHRDENIKKLIGMEVNFNKNELLISSSIFIQIKSTINFFILRNILSLSIFKKYTDHIIKDHQYSIKTNMRKIDSVINNETMPFFLYSHFVLPHDPYCFNKNGTLNKTQKDYFNPIDSNYIKNVLYANVIIDSIAKSFYNSNKTKNTIIIIQGDHGARVENIKLNDDEKRGILNLIYLPDQNYSIFNDSTSNLKTHIKILNKYFNQDFNESSCKKL
jgi:phosphoglycerol transferase MdoB-like AlkP superfamily enzyme